ncbi:MAG: alcohol dehydrogenase-like regulatory protein ErcA [Phycisphaerae bacterium]
MSMHISRELRKFLAPEFIFGWEARRLAGRFAHLLGVTKALLVTDEGVMQAGWAGQVQANLEQNGISTVLFSGLTSNPKDHEMMAGTDRYRRCGCDGIVAVGGGSSLDCAKGIGVVAANSGHILDYIGVDEINIPSPPLICVPTTAGSSADVSQFAVVTDTEAATKRAIVSKMVVPDVSLIDPETTVTMDAELTAHSGIDALCHACEAYASNASSPITDLHALEGARLAARWLPEAVRELDNVEARTQMMLASLHAGLAFSNASLGAVHAMSHVMGGMLDLPHGECNALLLGVVGRYNAREYPERYARLVETITGRACESDEVPECFQQAIQSLREEVGVTGGLKSVGITEDQLPALADKAMRDACVVTNPRRVSQEDLEELYAEAL